MRHLCDHPDAGERTITPLLSELYGVTCTHMCFARWKTKTREQLSLADLRSYYTTYLTQLMRDDPHLAETALLSRLKADKQVICSRRTMKTFVDQLRLHILQDRSPVFLLLHIPSFCLLHIPPASPQSPTQCIYCQPDPVSNTFCICHQPDSPAFCLWHVRL